MVDTTKPCPAEGVYYCGSHLSEWPRSQTAPVSYCPTCLGFGRVPDRYAIIMAYPSGETFYIRAGNHFPQPVAPYYGRVSAEETRAHMATVNPGFTFSVVPYPTDAYATF